MKKTLSLIMSGVLCVSIFYLAGCTKKDLLSIKDSEKLKKISFSNEKNNLIELPLYFDSTTNNKTAEITNEVRIIPKDEVLGELTMQELIKGPSVTSKSKPILPNDTRLISFSIKDGIAYVNLSEEAAVPMSAVKEEACLESIIYSLCQISTIKKVMIQINNKNVDTLGGNFNISKPLGKEDIKSARKK